MRARLVALTPLAVLVFLWCPGCGSKEGPYVAATVPVKGSVTYQGKKLTQGEVTFESLENGREAHGRIQPDGTFVLTTFKEGDGALAGDHRVAVAEADKAIHLPAKFSHVSSS